MTTKKGFTLIELLVVIAIIGILASVVLASLNSARDGAKDAAIQASISALRTEAELFSIDNSDYDGFCAAEGAATSAFGVSIANNGGTLVCATTATTGANFRVSSVLNDGATWFCADSTGTAVEVTSAPSGDAC